MMSKGDFADCFERAIFKILRKIGILDTTSELINSVDYLEDIRLFCLILDRLTFTKKVTI